MNERYIRAYEHQTLRTTPFGQLPPEAHKEFLERLPSLPQGALAPTHDGLRTGSYCGLLQAGDWTLEILPKIYATTERGPNRGLLIRMLEACFHLPIWHHGTAAASWSDDLLHIVFQAFLDEAQRQFLQGWIKSYVDEEERLTLPRGKLNVTKQIRRGRAQAHQLHCEFDELTIDNQFNRTVKAALALMRSHVPVGSKLAVHADQLDLTLADVVSVVVTISALRSLPHNRITRRHEHLLLLSGWIIQLLGPDVHKGEHSGLSLLFDMNRLFQDYLATSLERVIQRHPWRERLKLTREHPTRFLVHDQNEVPRFMMKPDLCLHLDGKLISILDAKWKLLEPQEYNPKAGVSQSDLYQLLAYGFTYRCDQLALVYPHQPSLTGRSPPSLRFRSTENMAIRITLATFDLDNSEDSAEALLAKQLGDNIG